MTQRMKKPNKMTVFFALIGLCSVGASGTLSVLTASKEVQPAAVTLGTVDISADPLQLQRAQTAANMISENKEAAKGSNIQNINPGDRLPLTLTIHNDGSKSVLTRSYLYVMFDDPAMMADYHLLVKDKEGWYGPKNQLVEITDGTKIVTNPGTAKEALTNVAVATGSYTIGGVTKRARRYEFRYLLNGYKGAAETEAIGRFGTNGTKNTARKSFDHTYELYFQVKSMAPYSTMNKGIQFHALTTAVQYRNTSDKDLDDKGLLDPNWKGD